MEQTETPEVTTETVVVGTPVETVVVEQPKTE